MVSTLDSGSKGPGLSRVITCCVVFFGKTLYSHSASPHPGVPVNCQGNLTKCWGITCDGLAPHPGGVEILLVA